MADNFDFKKYLVENKLGPFSKIRENLEEAPIQWSKVFTGVPQTGGDPYISLRISTDDSGDYVVVDYKKDGDLSWTSKSMKRSEIGNMIRNNNYITLPVGNYRIPDEAVELIKGQSATSAIRATQDPYGNDPNRRVDYDKEDLAMGAGLSEALSYEAIERIEGLVDMKALIEFKTAVSDIAEDLVNKEGFEYSDVRDYLTMIVKEILG